MRSDDSPTVAAQAARARAMIDANAYMTIASADAVGVPWASPVWFAHHQYTEFLWVSRPDARHSNNITARAEVGIVIFDSTVPEGSGDAVYLEGIAREAGEAERSRMLVVLSSPSYAKPRTARQRLRRTTAPRSAMWSKQHANKAATRSTPHPRAAAGLEDAGVVDAVGARLCLSAALSRRAASRLVLLRDPACEASR
jgi:Pyridoxamine 5'-phosphate oxidase